VIPWLQTFLKANQAIVGNKITLNVINMSDTSDTPCTLDPVHREYFEDRFAFIQRENMYYEFASGTKYKKLDFIEGNSDRMSIDAKGKEQNSAHLWAHDKNREMFKELVYLPGKATIVTNPDALAKPFYNTWRSAGALPDARGRCDLFYELLLHMCNGDVAHAGQYHVEFLMPAVKKLFDGPSGPFSGQYAPRSHSRVENAR